MNKNDQIFKRLTDQAQEAINFLAKEGFERCVHYYYKGIYLQGSQNYGTDHAGSDVDSKFILIPTFRGLMQRKKMVYDLTTSTGEKVSIKHLGDYLDLFWKANINNLEILTTYYYSSCDFITLLRSRNYANKIPELVKGTLWSSAIGTMFQMRKSVEKGTQATRAFVDRNGYDPKYAGHLIRVNALLERLADGMPFTQALDFSTHPRFQMYQALRQDGVFDKQHVFDMLDFYMQETLQLRDRVNPTDDPKALQLKEALHQEYINHVLNY